MNTDLDSSVRELEQRLGGVAGEHPHLALSPVWWQQRLLDWANQDPDFRVKLLRFVDVLPTLRSAAAVADHVRQYFRDAGPRLVQTTSGVAAQPAFRPVLSRVVREGVFSMSRRFIAGADPAEALHALRELAGHGIGFTIDLLGEATLSDVEADAYLSRYVALLETLAAEGETVAPHGERWQGVPPINISIKLSALCSHFEPAAPEYVSSTVRDRLRPFLRLARQRGAFINFDMEQFRYKDLVQRTFFDLLLEPEFADFADVGIVLQAYLRDAADDLDRLHGFAKRRNTPFTIRLVKGAYWDEERIVADQNSWPAPVYEEKTDTDACFERCTDALLSAWPNLRPAFGTHNPRSIAQAIVKARGHGLRDSDIEFQFLFGMAEGLRATAAAEGYRTRVYVPIGEIIPGMAYLVRRLLENTSNQAWFNAALDSSASMRTAQPVEAIRRAPRVFQGTSPACFFDPPTRDRMASALAEARDSFGTAYPLLIGDSRVSGRPQSDVRYPAEPETAIGRVACGSLEDVDTAVAVARRAFPAWRDRPAAERAAILHRAADIIEDRRFDLAATMIFESAKPWHEADGDVVEAADYLRYYAAEVEELAAGSLLGDKLGERNEYFHQGRGVAAIIAPWNFPLAIITGMSAAALAAGNAAILKPASQSPIIAYHLVDILRKAGVPPEVVQFLPGKGSEVGQALVDHTGVDLIAFTGSNAVGLSMIAAAGMVRSGQRNVKRVIAELGGKNAIVIDDDADLDEAVYGSVTSAFGYAGQKCSACSRLIIVGSAYDEAIERLRHAVASLVVGPPHDPATFVPPVISAGARDSITRYIESGRSAATLLVQGEIPADGGYYVPPTVFTDVAQDADIACDEIFGPVLAVFRAGSFAGALEIATDSSFALTGGVFSRNPRHIEMARRRFQVGNLYINRKITGAIVGRQPFGGLRMSGIGEKAGGPHYLLQFMEPRVVTENTMRQGFAPEEGA